MQYFSVMFYIKNRRWMSKSFDSFTEAYAYASERINENGFRFREILVYKKRGVFNYQPIVIDNINGIHAFGKAISTREDVEAILNEEKNN